MNWADIDLRPSRATLRHFGLIAAALCLSVAALEWGWRHRINGTAAAVIVGIGAVVALLGLIAPSWLRPIFVAITVLTFPIGWLITRVFLSLIFCVVFAPVGIVMRMAGKDPLHRKIDRDAESYWRPKKMAGDAESYLRQF